ncbi:MAG TPA: VOC family protein [Solirubrobacterales bacterium]|nr:VOC family protein [Solirubrobacterales bacterium]
MNGRDRYIPGVPCWVDTTQPDPGAAVEFYAGLFGWELEDTMPPDAPGSYFIARLGGGDVGAISSPMGEAPTNATWNTYVWVDSADEAAAKVGSAGGTVMAEPFDVMEAGRMAVCADREGAAFCLWQPNRHRGATVVNEAGSVNFNNLNTRDLEAAREFYGAVFGWELLTLDNGGRMWRLPGYGEFLDELNPGTVERMAEMGAPRGFEDVVAGINPIPEELTDTPPQWGVTFAVEDADAIAARARELGGAVLAEPFDAPWVRMAVIADPQGATFIASKFVPENRDL